MKEETPISGRIYQDTDFVVSDFSNVLLEGLLGMEDLEDREPLLVFIKIKDKNWNRFFLDAGTGFWENWQETEVDQSEAHIDEVVYVDYKEKYQLDGKEIESVRCHNSQIIITFKGKEQFILREINPGDHNTASEIIAIPQV